MNLFYCFNFSAYIRFFVKVLIEMNIDSSNEINFSDVYRSVNYIVSLAELMTQSLGVHGSWSVSDCLPFFI